MLILGAEFRHGQLTGCDEKEKSLGSAGCEGA